MKELLAILLILWFAHYSNALETQNIRTIAYVEGLAINAQLNSPTGIAVSPNSEIVFTDTAKNIIRKITRNNTILTLGGNIYGYENGMPINRQLMYPCEVAINSRGEIFVIDGNTILRLWENSAFSKFAGIRSSGYSGDGGLATEAKLNGPMGVSFTSTNEMIIADTYNNRIRKVLNNGTISTIAGTGIEGYSGDGGLAIKAELKAPIAVAVTPKDEIVFADTLNYRIRN